LPDHSGMKLGRNSDRTDPRTLAIGKYLATSAPPPPPACDWTAGITGWGMMMNDQVNNCTIVAAAHAIKVWTANNGGVLAVRDTEIAAAYQKWGGYVLNDPVTDTGGIELQVLNSWRHEGLGGHQLLAFAAADRFNLTEIRHCIALFGGVYVGFALPLASRFQDVWDVVPEGGPNTVRGSWGGHCVFVPKYDQDTFTCITWGQLKTVTLPFWEAYCDEAHALLGHDWLNAKPMPSHFNHNQLLADLAGIS
jgi:hypothetical protein